MSEERPVSPEYRESYNRISAEERASIVTLASLRRIEVPFRDSISHLDAEKADVLRVKASTDYVPAFLYAELNFDQWKQKITELEQMAIQEESEHNFLLACFRYTAAARIALKVGNDATAHSAGFRRCIKSLEREGVDDDLLAFVLSTERLLSRDLVLPAPEAVVEEVNAGHAGVLRDYALVLPPEQREHFLSHFRDQKGDKKGLSRPEVSAILDRLIAQVYQSGAVVDGEEQQVVDIRDRAEQVVEKTLESPLDADTRRMMRLLAKTIAQLPGEESKQLLRRLADTSRVKVRSNTQATTSRIRMGVSIAREAFEVDRQNGGSIMKKFLGSARLSAPIWNEFVQALIRDGQISKQIER
ncbi:MAG: hypothetical protein COV60_02225, partial [Candidatus Magasanikbacteria bacterium CG11_big_fil_rev_8_21_14_0_20_43_7]